MRTAVDEAISAISTARLPRSLFAQRDELLPAPTSYWLFIPSPSGYSVREHTGSAPPRGGDLVLDEVTYRVALVGRSPFLDGRTCAYLEQRESSPPSGGQRHEAPSSRSGASA